MRTNGQIYERTIEHVTDPELKRRVLQALAARYDFDAEDAIKKDTTWIFHYAPPSPAG